MIRERSRAAAPNARRGFERNACGIDLRNAPAAPAGVGGMGQVYRGRDTTDRSDKPRFLRKSGSLSSFRVR